MLPPERLDRICAVFDDHLLVANAGLLLPVTPAHHLGVGELVDHLSRVNHIFRFGVNQFCRFTSSAWPHCWAASVR